MTVYSCQVWEFSWPGSWLQGRCARRGDSLKDVQVKLLTPGKTKLFFLKACIFTESAPRLPCVYMFVYMSPPDVFKKKKVMKGKGALH